MRLLERFNTPKQKTSGFRGSVAQTKESVLASVSQYLALCLNYRLQPGAIENSLQYQQNYLALANLSEASHWPNVAAYLQDMEPRAQQLSIRALTNNESAQANKQLQQLVELPRPPRGLFAVQYRVDQSFNQLAAVALTNGRIFLLPVA